MRHEELQRLMKGRYVHDKSSKYVVAILKSCPEIVLTYKDYRDYVSPDEVKEFFMAHPDDQVHKHSDGFMYYSNESIVRMLDIGEDLNRLFESRSMQDYLERIVVGSKLNLVPSGWPMFQYEPGTMYRHKGKYCYLTYDIPEEENYKMCMFASRKNDDPKIKIEVFLTSLDSPFGDMYHSIYLTLVKGKVFDSKILPGQKLLKLGQ
jgi:hypothetical protein